MLWLEKAAVVCQLLCAVLAVIFLVRFGFGDVAYGILALLIGLLGGINGVRGVLKWQHEHADSGKG